MKMHYSMGTNYMQFYPSCSVTSKYFIVNLYFIWAEIVVSCPERIVAVGTGVRVTVKVRVIIIICIVCDVNIVSPTKGWTIIIITVCGLVIIVVNVVFEVTISIIVFEWEYEGVWEFFTKLKLHEPLWLVQFQLFEKSYKCKLVPNWTRKTDVTKTGNGEWGMGNGKLKMGNGKLKMGNWFFFNIKFLKCGINSFSGYYRYPRVIFLRSSPE